MPNQDPHNPVTKEKVALGNLLFFETGLAQIPLHDNCYESYSCGTCHLQPAGFLPGRVQGIADGGAGYGHNGNLRYDKLSARFLPLSLSKEEINQLVDFLENALYDPDTKRFVPESVLSGNCFPNNDAVSRAQLGCE